jgi:hypothetical protein
MALRREFVWGAQPLRPGIGISLASFLRFWAVAARRNSSRAPFGPRSSEPVETQNAFEVGEQHLDLPALPT